MAQRPSIGLALAVVLGAWLAPCAARATVAEQRARLPPPAECEDPVEGIWRAHQFESNRGEWYIFTLEIHRVKAGAPELTGTVRSEYWNGTPKDQEAPPCNSAGYHFHQIVHMPGKGTLREADVYFGGTSYTWEKDVCGTGHGGYNPDRFTGTIDAAIQEFQSVNNDGGAAVNVPTVFRRIHCFDEGAAAQPPPAVNVTPPKLFKPRARGGCQCAQVGAPTGRGFADGIGALGLLLAMCGARRRSRSASWRDGPVG